MMVCNKKIFFHNIFAPVVNWFTVRLNNIIDVMAGWESRSIDYVIDLYQALIDSDVYLHLPPGFHIDGTITMSQSAIINKILNSLRICGESKMHDTSANVIKTKN